MPPEDLDVSTRIPGALRPLFQEGILSWSQLAPLVTRLSVGERFVFLLGSEEGFDSTRWSLEHDAALADLAARRLAPSEPALADPSHAADLRLARAAAREGLSAYSTNRR